LIVLTYYRLHKVVSLIDGLNFSTSRFLNRSIKSSPSYHSAGKTALDLTEVNYMLQF